MEPMNLLIKNINAAVILAAGKGIRISNTDNYVSKPLLKLYDMTLIERSIFNLNHKLNVKKFYIVTGYKHDAVHDFLEELKNKINVEINIVFANEWKRVMEQVSCQFPISLKKITFM